MATHGNDWMPLYIGDYLRDTTRLTVAEHGAYLLLIMDYWVNGPPPDDDRELARIARTPLATWRQYRRGTLMKLFAVRGGRWIHKRIEAELTYARELNEKKRRGGLASAASRRARNGTAQPEHRSEDSTQRVRVSVRAPLPCKEEGLAPQEANPVSLTAREPSPPPLPSRGDGDGAARAPNPKARDGYSDDLISPEEKAAALAELHRTFEAVRVKAASLNGHAEAPE